MAGAKILIVEDESIVALDMQDELRLLGYTVSGVAASGPEALAKAEETRPDLVLMDIKLRGAMDGVEVAEEIRTGFDVPVVYLTAYSDDSIVERVKATEPFGYLLKPFERRELRVAIEVALYKHAMEKQLREYTAALEARNRELDAFAHTVAHDLKGPVSSIAGFAEFLKGGEVELLDDDVRLCAQRIASSAHKMNNVINELLLLAEVRSTDVEARLLDMASIVEAARKRLEPMAERYQAQTVVPETWPVAVGYGPWVEEVWVNYLSNGIKYGGRPPRLELGTDVSQDIGLACRSARFWVRDNGPGIGEEEQSRLFVPFTRLEKVRAEGHGLGLSIVRRIVDKLGGEVGVQSEPGKGSLFYFALPLADGMEQG